MIVLAKPDPSDMVQAIKKAISILPKIDPQEMHNHVSALFQKLLSLGALTACTVVKICFFGSLLVCR